MQAANFLTIFGALDRLGGFFVLGAVREIGPSVTAIVVAGVAGTAITADLGARKVREELDALQVLGVDPVKNLVVPRFLALMLVTGLFDIYALLFGIFGGIIAELVNGQPLGPFWATLFANASTTDLWGSVLKTTIYGAIIAIVCCYKGMAASGGAEGVGRAVNEAVVLAFTGDLLLRLRLHADAAGHPPADPGDQVMGNEWLALPREWLGATGEIGRFTGTIVRDVYGLRVFRFFGESLRQCGILIVGSTTIIWTLMFILGLQCGIEGAYFTAAQGAPAYSGVFTAWCDLREITPYAFGYMMSAKVGTGIVAELGAMRISDEIDALEVMGINSMTFLCATRLLASWLVLPFMYMAGIGAAFLASYIAVVQQIGYVSSGGYFLIFWQFQNPPDFLYSLIKAMFMATAIVLVACYYGYNASGGPVGVGKATAKSMVLNLVLVHVIGMLGTQIFWGANPRAPIGG